MSRNGDVDVDDPDVPGLRGSIEIGHMRSQFDLYGGRDGSIEGRVRHMRSAVPPEPGWLGNPHRMDEDTVDERRRVIAAFLRDFLDRVETDPAFRDAVEGLRGQRVACWCRGVSQDRQPDNWCHLDVVKHWLDGDLAPVFEYLRANHP